MRIWDLPPSILCRQHLLGEHRELHAIWTYLTTGKGGAYRKHPETLRWKNRLLPLFKRHDVLVKEMEARGYNHQSRLRVININKFVTGRKNQTEFLHTIAEQKEILRKKGCDCKV